MRRVSKGLKTRHLGHEVTHEANTGEKKKIGVEASVGALGGFSKSGHFAQDCVAAVAGKALRLRNLRHLRHQGRAEARVLTVLHEFLGVSSLHKSTLQPSVGIEVYRGGLFLEFC